ncbi:MAG: dihydrolipoamide acetyltransferase family protein [Agitococcus sp.]|nr:dihydrolipoamide acetyltransferase family protein [Agitococcus sp.]
MKTFTLPDLGEGLHDATIVEWYAQKNSRLKQGDRLLAVETAKAIVEIPAPENLVIHELLVPINTVAQVGVPLIHYHSDSDSKAPAVLASNNSSVSVVGTLVEASLKKNDRLFIRGQDRFSKDELRQSELALHTIHRPITHTSDKQQETSQILTLSGARLTMTQQLSQAHQQVALVTLFDEVQIKWRKKTRPLPRLIRALCAGCIAEPKLNSWFETDKLVIHKDINIGIAINTPHGLLVPVLNHAQSMTLDEIAIEVKKLQIDAQERRLPPSTLQGATISLSNFGMMAGRFATPMVVPPQVAILGVGRIEARYWLNKRGKVKQSQVIPLSLSFDHRVLTGGEAALFLAAVMIDLALKE